MNWKKIKLFLSMHWMRILIISGIAALTVSLIFFIANGIKAWKDADPYLRQSQMAMAPIQLYMQLVMSIFFGMIYTLMWYWLMFKKGASSFTHTKRSRFPGKKINITWNDVIGMDEAKEEALEIVNLIKDRAQLQRMGEGSCADCCC